MANGHRDDPIPEKGTPEYEWLYGAGSPDDEATEVLPERLRSEMYPPPPPRGRRQTAPYAGNQAPPPYQPPPGHRRASERPAPPPSQPPTQPPGSGRGGRRRRFPVLRLLGLLLVLWIVFLVAVPIWAWNNVERIDAMPDGDRPGNQPGTTYLIVGSDSRAGLSEEERAELYTGDAEGNRTDTILMVHTGSGDPVVVSFPRDSQVELPDGGSMKINAVYAAGGDEGAKYLVETIEHNTGVRIDHYAEIGMGGVADVIDAVGGIEVCPKDPIKDIAARIDLDAGCQEVDGVTGLNYARARCSKNGLPECPLVNSDLDRVQNQREVVAAVGSKAARPINVLLPWRYVSLNKAATSFIAVDEDTNVLEGAKLALALRAIGSGSTNCTVPLTGSSAESWDTERADALFAAIAEDAPDDITDAICTPNGLATS